jgi:hypothetical protein
MPDLTFDFKWYRDTKGYTLVPAKTPRLRPGQSLLEGTAKDFVPARIVRKGGKLQSYRPLEQFEKLFDVFIKMATTEKGVLEFVQKFGPLTNEGLRGHGDVVFDVIEQAREMLQFAIIPLHPLNVQITNGPDGMQLKVSPECLLDALWLQMAQAGAQSRECRQCRRRFVIGAGRRRDARFCSDACRIKFNSLERSRR